MKSLDSYLLFVMFLLIIITEKQVFVSCHLLRTRNDWWHNVHLNKLLDYYIMCLGKR